STRHAPPVSPRFTFDQKDSPSPSPSLSASRAGGLAAGGGAGDGGRGSDVVIRGSNTSRGSPRSPLEAPPPPPPPPAPRPPPPRPRPPRRPLPPRPPPPPPPPTAPDRLDHGLRGDPFPPARRALPARRATSLARLCRPPRLPDDYGLPPAHRGYARHPVPRLLAPGGLRLRTARHPALRPSRAVAQPVSVAATQCGACS